MRRVRSHLNLKGFFKKIVDEIRASMEKMTTNDEDSFYSTKPEHMTDNEESLSFDQEPRIAPSIELHAPISMRNKSHSKESEPHEQQPPASTFTTHHDTNNSSMIASPIFNQLMSQIQVRNRDSKQSLCLYFELNFVNIVSCLLYRTIIGG